MFCSSILDGISIERLLIILDVHPDAAQRITTSMAVVERALNTVAPLPVPHPDLINEMTTVLVGRVGLRTVTGPDGDAFTSSADEFLAKSVYHLMGRIWPVIPYPTSAKDYKDLLLERAWILSDYHRARVETLCTTGITGPNLPADVVAAIQHDPVPAIADRHLTVRGEAHRMAAEAFVWTVQGAEAADVLFELNDPVGVYGSYRVDLELLHSIPIIPGETVDERSGHQDRHVRDAEAITRYARAIARDRALDLNPSVSRVSAASGTPAIADEQCWTRALALVDDSWRPIATIAATLLRTGFVSATDVMDVVRRQRE